MLPIPQEPIFQKELTSEKPEKDSNSVPEDPYIEEKNEQKREEGESHSNNFEENYMENQNSPIKEPKDKIRPLEKQNLRSLKKFVFNRLY